MAITGEMIAAKARELLTMGNIPYVNGGTSPRGMDCQGLVKWTMRELGLRADFKGTNDIWRNYLSERGSISDCVKRHGSVPIGTLIFIRDFDGGEQARGYYDDQGNIWHVYIKIASGLLIHASASNERVLTRAFADKEIDNGGPNTYGLLDSADYGFVGGGSVDVPGTGSGSSSGGLTGRNCRVIGGALNLRKVKKKAAVRVCQVPDGAMVLCVRDEGDYSWLYYQGPDNSTRRNGTYEGFAPTEFLEAVDID